MRSQTQNSLECFRLKSFRSKIAVALVVFLIGIVVPTFISKPAGAQPQNSTGSPRQKLSRPKISRPGPRGNPDIPKIVSEVSAQNIEATIRKLVGFGTRNTLSEQNDPNRGIGAARDWLYAEFQKAAAQSGGRMTVEKQIFEQAKAARVPQPTMLTNIVATLKGMQPESTNRVYVVSGHYDSMCSSPTDAKCDAPGANDDASQRGRRKRLAIATAGAVHKGDD